MKEINEDWKLEGYARYFQWHLEDLRQNIASFLVLIFGLLRDILEGKNEQVTKDFVENAEAVYEVLCLRLTERSQEPETPYYKRMINHLLEATQDPIFFIPAHKLSKIDKKTEESIEQCVRYENEYRKLKKQADSSYQFEEIM